MKLEKTAVLHGNCLSKFAGVLFTYECALRDYLLIDDDYEVTITSANDSVHSHNSLHYRNEAIDVRISDLNLLNQHQNKLMEAIVLRIGQRYAGYVFIAHLYDGQNHIHMQYSRDNIVSFDSAIGENKNVFIK